MATENQALEEPGHTGGEKIWTIGGRRVGRFTGFVYGERRGKTRASRRRREDAAEP